MVYAFYYFIPLSLKGKHIDPIFLMTFHNINQTKRLMTTKNSSP